MATERLLTYAAAARMMGITEKAFRDRAYRGSIPLWVLVKRSRGEGKRPERFVLASAFDTWLRGESEAPPEGKETAA